MADKPLFSLDAEGRWRLAYDRQQWLVQRRAQKPRVKRLEGHAIADSGWRGVSFVGGKKATLGRLFREKGIVLTAEAGARFDALPDNFPAFIAALERFFARPEAVAALAGHGLTPPESTEALSAAT